MKPNRGLNREIPVPWLGYLAGIGLVVLVTVLSYRVFPSLSSINVVLLYLLCVVLTSFFAGLGPSIMTCILAVLAYDYFFVKPVLSLGPLEVQDVPILFALLIVGILISYLASRSREKTEEIKQRELETRTLYLLSRSLATSSELDSSLHAVVKSARETLGYDISIFLPDGQSKKNLKMFAGSIKPGVVNDLLSSVTWAYEHQNRAGMGTNIFSDAKALCVPLVTARGTIGVMALSLTDTSPMPIKEQGLLIADSGELITEREEYITATPESIREQEQLIDAFADLVALAIERMLFAEEARTIQMSLAATEKLQTALLDSISHDLRTPLASVVGVLTSLQEEFGLDNAAKKNLIQIGREEAERLNYSITNLLDMSRIEAGVLKVSRQLCDVDEILSVTLTQLGERAAGRTIKVDVAADVPLVSADFGLLVKVLLNLLDNAIKYSFGDLPIEVRVWRNPQALEVEVADRGKGIPPQDLPYIFQRFYHPAHSGEDGVGLGLSICKGIVEAHGGHISAENRYGGGAIFRITLPLLENNLGEKGQMA